MFRFRDLEWRWSHEIGWKFDLLRNAQNHELANQPIGIAHHYTVADTAKKILERGKLWATDVAFLNDPTEWKHGHEIFAEDLLSRRGEHLAPFAQVLLKSLADEIRSHVEKTFLIMVASLCKDADNLAMWGRTYADDGKGVSIAIDLTKVPAAEKGGAAASRLLYEETDKRDRTARIVTEHFCLFRLLRGLVPGGQLRKQLALSLSVQAGIYASTFKHEDYESEKEWRLVQLWSGEGHPTPPVQTRTTAGGKLAKFVEVEVGKAIVAMIVGPKAPATAVEEWRSWLKTIGRDDIKVSRSAVPYRDA